MEEREEARRQAQALLPPLERHLTEAKLGHVSEIFEGDAPHRPCGCIAQACRVAEIPHVYSEELRGLWPNTRPCGHAAQSKNRSEGPTIIFDVVAPPSDPRIAPRELLDYQVIFRGTSAPSRHPLQPVLGLSITRFIKSGGLRRYQFPFAFLSPEHC